MNQPKKSFLLTAFFLCCFCLTAAFAQTPTSKLPEPNFDVILQTVVASNGVGVKSDFASSLNDVVKKLKSDFSYSSYRLTSTFIYRINNRGGISTRNISVLPGGPPTFSDFRIEDLETLLGDKEEEIVRMREFSFNQRVMIGNSSGIVSYEQIGLNLKFSLPKNTPTTVGSLIDPDSGGLMFLILTVRASEK